MPWWNAPAPELLLAPMADFTNAPMRVVSGEFGAAFCHTEMVYAGGLASGSHASWRILGRLPGEGPCAAHLYGSRPDDFAAAAERIAETGGFESIDINCGCPVPRIRACGAGSALMGDPALVGRIVAAIVSHCPLPVTVKTRLAPIPGVGTALELIRAAADNGAVAAAVHARYTSQFNAGDIDVGALAEVVARSPVPIAANGGIRSGADALRLLRESGARTVMVGWAAVGNPWLLRAVSESLRKGEPVPTEAPAPAERRAVLERHLELSRVHHGQVVARWPYSKSKVTEEEALSLDFRLRLFRYLNGLPGASRFRARLSEYRTEADIRAAIAALTEADSGGGETSDR